MAGRRQSEQIDAETGTEERVTDPQARRGVPERWLLPPAPRDPGVSASWHERSFAHRRRLARVRPDELATLTSSDLEVVAALAEARIATSWRLLGAAVVRGGLVLMTVWGFGRSTYPADSGAWLLAGLGLGCVVATLGALRAASRGRRARAIADTLRTRGNDPPGRAV